MKQDWRGSSEEGEKFEVITVFLLFSPAEKVATNGHLEQRRSSVWRPGPVRGSERVTARLQEITSQQSLWKEDTTLTDKQGEVPVSNVGCWLLDYFPDNTAFQWRRLSQAGVIFRMWTTLKKPSGGRISRLSDQRDYLLIFILLIRPTWSGRLRLQSSRTVFFCDSLRSVGLIISAGKTKLTAKSSVWI